MFPFPVKNSFKHILTFHTFFSPLIFPCFLRTNTYPSQSQLPISCSVWIPVIWGINWTANKTFFFIYPQTSGKGNNSFWRRSPTSKWIIQGNLQKGKENRKPPPGKKKKITELGVTTNKVVHVLSSFLLGLPLNQKPLLAFKLTPAEEGHLLPWF